MAVVNFEPIFDEDIPNGVDLCTDQKYLLEMAQAICSGKCSKSLALRDPRIINHARWVTKANRIMRVYIATENPSDALLKIVKYIIHVYVPAWFRIRKDPSCFKGPSHFNYIIQKCKTLSPDTFAAIKPVIENNAYFAHHENLLLGMMTDDRQEVRELAVRRILDARKAPKDKSNEVRFFKKPSINFDCEEYQDLIYWDKTKITPPPLLADIADDDLENYFKNLQIKKSERLPCHTQAVESL